MSAFRRTNDYRIPTHDSLVSYQYNSLRENAKYRARLGKKNQYTLRAAEFVANREQDELDKVANQVRKEILQHYGFYIQICFSQTKHC